MSRPIPLDLLSAAANDDDGIDASVHCSQCPSLCCRLTVVLKTTDRVAEALTATVAPSNATGTVTFTEGATTRCANVALIGTTTKTASCRRKLFRQRSISSAARKKCWSVTGW